MMSDKKLTGVIRGELKRLTCGIEAERRPVYNTIEVADLDSAIVPRFAILWRKQLIGDFKYSE
jgi:hypothetical protein